MRKSGICTKCTSNDLVHVGAVADVSGRHNTTNMEMHLAIMFVGDGFLGEKTERVGKVSAVVCHKCGYTELYVVDPTSIQPDGKYITSMTGPASTTPHR